MPNGPCKLSDIWPFLVIESYRLMTKNLVLSACLPDGTVQVTNPNVGLYSHVFAVQDEGVSAAVKCSVVSSGAESNITGCSQVN